jgi:hypothetical protein
MGMPSVRLKEGVNVQGLRSEMILALFYNYGSDVVITSGVDGKHSETSRHYVGLGEDFRIWYLKPEDLPKVAEELQQALGEQYYVRLESDHIHVSFKPRR